MNIFGQRLPQHVRDLVRKDHGNEELLRDFIRHGIEGFTLRVLKRCRQSQLDDYEDYYIYSLNAFYNKVWSDSRPINRRGGQIVWKEFGGTRPPKKSQKEKLDQEDLFLSFCIAIAMACVIILVFSFALK